MRYPAPGSLWLVSEPGQCEHAVKAEDKSAKPDEMEGRRSEPADDSGAKPQGRQWAALSPAWEDVPLTLLEGAVFSPGDAVIPYTWQEAKQDSADGAVLPVWLIGTDRMGWVPRSLCEPLTADAASVALQDVLLSMHSPSEIVAECGSIYADREHEFSTQCTQGL